MNSSSSGRSNGGGMEENILAILDASEAKDNQDADDDRFGFLEAVRANSVVSESRIPPTYKMYEAIFKILRIGKSLELIMASYQLLNELDKCFPSVRLAKADNATSAMPEIVVDKEAWFPFALNPDAEREASKDCGIHVDSSGFQLLIQDLAGVAYDSDFSKCDTKSLRNMILFHYLVNVLAGDFLPRNNVYKETMSWMLLKESLLNSLLASRKMNYKNLMRDCLDIMCKLHQLDSAFSDDIIHTEMPTRHCDAAVAIALREIVKKICTAIRKFLNMILELDLSRSKADEDGLITRADGVRTPLLEIILDELTYNEDILPPFLQVFNEPKWKLEVIVQYFWKYIVKPSVKTRRSNSSTDDTTFNGVLKCFSNVKSTKTNIKKIGAELIQLLLAHGFQAYMFLLSGHHHNEGIPSTKERACTSQVQACEDIISVFRNLRSAEGQMEILSIGREVLFMAATILSMK